MQEDDASFLGGGFFVFWPAKATGQLGESTPMLYSDSLVGAGMRNEEGEKRVVNVNRCAVVISQRSSERNCTEEQPATQFIYDGGGDNGH